MVTREFEQARRPDRRQDFHRRRADRIVHAGRSAVVGDGGDPGPARSVSPCRGSCFAAASSHSHGGKLKTLVQGHRHRVVHPALQQLARPVADRRLGVMWAAIVLTVVTGVDYVVSAIRTPATPCRLTPFCRRQPRAGFGADRAGPNRGHRRIADRMTVLMRKAWGDVGVARRPCRPGPHGREDVDSGAGQPNCPSQAGPWSSRPPRGSICGRWLPVAEAHRRRGPARPEPRRFADRLRGRAGPTSTRAPTCGRRVATMSGRLDIYFFGPADPDPKVDSGGPISWEPTGLRWTSSGQCNVSGGESSSMATRFVKASAT